MVRYRDEDEREKLSWSEIDKRRDRSPHAPKEISEHRPPTQRSEWIKKQYRKEIDKLFLGKKGTKKHEKALNDISQHHGTDQFGEAVKNYLEQYGLPEDWSTLSLLLDYSEIGIVSEALASMRKLYETRTPAEQKGFKAKVDIFAMTASNSDLRELAEEILPTL
jgi:hypothetical protein